LFDIGFLSFIDHEQTNVSLLRKVRFNWRKIWTNKCQFL